VYQLGKLNCLDLPCCAEVGDFSESLARGFCNDLPSKKVMIQGVQLAETLPMFYTPAHFLVSCTFPVYRALFPRTFVSLMDR
jgi:hypothetical protein